MRLLSLFLLININTAFLVAQQDSIVLLNGKVYRGTIISVDKGVLTYTGTEKKKQGVVIELTTDRLFSYVQNDKETVCYVQNEFIGDFLTVEEARRSTLGSYDARMNFKPHFVFYSSWALGLGVSLLDTYYTQSSYNKFVTENGVPPVNATVGFFGIRPTLMPVLVPLVLSATWGIPSFRIKGDQIIQKNMIGDASYYRGFHRIAKQRRIFAALSGSAIGIGAGMISYFVFTPN
ncbi:MAG: hypothetical protein HYZ14_18160 [Bacteroidetes bacterium]|nr:hypothetical protein [Bacteroidota bacterium]